MKIERIETLSADAGYRTARFLKLTTDDGRVGWSEFYDGFSGVPLAPVIAGFARLAIGRDPRAWSALTESLLATSRLASGGLAHQAVAAIENACLDVAARACGLPVYALFGGPFRDSVPVYWTHCGSYRVRHASFYEAAGHPPIRSLDDFVAVGREAAEAGFRVIKTNPVFFEGGTPRFFNGGFRIEPGFLDRSMSDARIEAVVDQLSALRQGAGPGMGLMLDVSFSQRTEGYLRLARRLESLGLVWLELDTRDVDALATIRAGTRTPIASLESLHGVHDYRPFLAARTVDTAIVDPLWNGVAQSVRIASLADAYDVHVAPHNPVGELGNLMSAHFCAAVPNLRILEYRHDEAVFSRSFVTRPAVVRDGRMHIPDGPGWGAEVDERALAEHPASD